MRPVAISSVISTGSIAMSPGEVPGSHSAIASAVISGFMSAFYRGSAGGCRAGGVASRIAASLRGRERDAATGSARLPAEVAERLIPLADRLPETRFRRTPLEAEALLGVTGDPVEEGAQHLGRLQALRVERLIHQQLVHD